jgi:hypothetical protein
MRALLLLALLPLAACQTADSGSALPDGWSQDGNRFWAAGVDTTGLFPDLETPESMGIIADTTFDERDRAGWVARNLKRRMLALYRNQPQLVDSVFEARIPTMIAERDLGGALGPVVDEMERPVRNALLEGFYPSTGTVLAFGKDIDPPVFPDSLAAQMEGARVKTQVALGADGFADAVLILEPTHPTLEQLAVDVIARQKWNAGYVTAENTNRRDRTPSWVRYNVLFGRPPAE